MWSPDSSCELSERTATKTEGQPGFAFTEVVSIGEAISVIVESSRFDDGDSIFIGGATEVTPARTGKAIGFHVFDGHLHSMDDVLRKTKSTRDVGKLVHKVDRQLSKAQGTRVTLKLKKAHGGSAARLSVRVNDGEWVDADEIFRPPEARFFAKMGIDGDAVSIVGEGGGTEGEASHTRLADASLNPNLPRIFGDIGGRSALASASTGVGGPIRRRSARLSQTKAKPSYLKRSDTELAQDLGSTLHLGTNAADEAVVSASASRAKFLAMAADK